MSEALGVVRRWIQWNTLNGSTVTWGSSERLQFSKDLTVVDLEALALEIEEEVKANMKPIAASC